VEKTILGTLNGTVLSWHYIAKEHPEEKFAFTRSVAIELVKSIMPSQFRVFSKKEEKRYANLVKEFAELDADLPAEHFGAHGVKLDQLIQRADWLGEFCAANSERFQCGHSPLPQAD